MGEGSRDGDGDGDRRRDDDGDGEGDGECDGDGEKGRKKHPSLSRGCVLELWFQRLRPAIFNPPAICGRRSWVLGGDAALAPYATGKGEMNGRQKRRRG